MVRLSHSPHTSLPSSPTQVTVAFFSRKSRHVSSMLKEACTAVGLPLTILKTSDGSAIAPHPENFKDMWALSCRRTAARTFDEMTTLLLSSLVTAHNGNLPSGKGYVEQLVRLRAGARCRISHERKAEP